MNKIQKIVHVADLHIRLFKRHEEYKEQFQKFFDECRKQQPERIVVVGDIVHSKNTVTPELISMVTSFFNECTKIAKTVVILGNHDFLVNNLDRMDTLSPIFEGMQNPDVMFLKHTGCYEDENIVWCVYGHMEGSQRPDIEKAKTEFGDDKTYVGLYHDPLIGLKTAIGFEFEDGKDVTIFEGCDMVMCGDVHLYDVMYNRETPIVMPGSMIMQDFGEKVKGHGYVLWDVETRSHKQIDIPSDYGFYTFKIKSIEDIENESEKLVNA
jgi:DNA repair exonuclease SbcCD nuclease subunit